MNKPKSVILALFHWAIVALLIGNVSGLFLEKAQACCEEYSDHWKIKLMPYGWFANVSGDVTARGVTRSIDADFGDIFDKLNIGFMGRAEAWRGRWGITGDLLYMDLEEEHNIGGADLDTGVEQWVVELGGGYHVGKWALGHSEDGKCHRHVSFDVLAGGRYINMESQIEVETPIHGEISDEDSWVSPYVGGRIKLEVVDRLKVFVMGDIGGFGVGSADITGNLITGLSYEVTDRINAIAGYRWFWIDADIADITLSGPILGASIRF